MYWNHVRQEKKDNSAFIYFLLRPLIKSNKTHWIFLLIFFIPSTWAYKLELLIGTHESKESTFKGPVTRESMGTRKSKGGKSTSPKLCLWTCSSTSTRHFILFNFFLSGKPEIPQVIWALHVKCWKWGVYLTFLPPASIFKVMLSVPYVLLSVHSYTQNKRRVVIALVSPISACDSQWCYILPIGSLIKISQYSILIR